MPLSWERHQCRNERRTALSERFARWTLKYLQGWRSWQRGWAPKNRREHQVMDGEEFVWMATVCEGREEGWWNDQ